MKEVEVVNYNRGGNSPIRKINLIVIGGKTTKFKEERLEDMFSSDVEFRCTLKGL